MTHPVVLPIGWRGPSTHYYCASMLASVLALALIHMMLR
jgi:hypothetical protein